MVVVDVVEKCRDEREEAHQEATVADSDCWRIIALIGMLLERIKVTNEEEESILAGLSTCGRTIHSQ